MTLLKFPQNIAIRNVHFFIVDFRNSKAAITIFTLALLFLFSLGSNIWQLNRKSQLKYNNLKYCYTKPINGINPENLYKLEDIFYYHRDKKIIRDIREKVGAYEKKVSEAAEKLMQSRINESNSQKLKRKIEAE